MSFKFENLCTIIIVTQPCNNNEVGKSSHVHSITCTHKIFAHPVTHNNYNILNGKTVSPLVACVLYNTCRMISRLSSKKEFYYCPVVTIKIDSSKSTSENVITLFFDGSKNRYYVHTNNDQELYIEPVPFPVDEND